MLILLLVAKTIKHQKLNGVAAIAPKIAAEIFNLKILEDEIQTIKNNRDKICYSANRKTNQQYQTNKQSVITF